jgi:hypothetical protein
MTPTCSKKSIWSSLFHGSIDKNVVENDFGDCESNVEKTGETVFIPGKRSFSKQLQRRWNLTKYPQPALKCGIDIY